jgi:lipoprotein-anchoring transpeptidase ErfK/SrfK
MPRLVAVVVAVLSAVQPPQIAPRTRGPVDALPLQVALDRAGFSPGAIDGKPGRNTAQALEAYMRDHGSEPPLEPQPLIAYTISDADAAGPFVEHIPPDLVDQASLPHLGYTDLVEALAERFHTSPDFLRRTNPQARFAAGETIQVPNVEPFLVPAPRIEPAHSERGAGSAAPQPVKPEVIVTVNAGTGSLTVADPGGRTVLFAPVTTGSEHDPLPLGEWNVTAVHFSPQFRYNPDLFWDADPSHTKALLQPGPNNPVGVVWIDLTKEHYGLHGTPEPAAIGRSQSHGCVRLTNWDAMRLAGLVQRGTRVVFAP